MSKVITVKGKVKFFNTDRGYGFAVPNDSNVDVLIHHSVIIMDGFRTLETDQVVEMKVKLNDNRDGLVAVEVVPEPMPRVDAKDAFELLQQLAA